ncbi:hypothetical protein [Ulvibacterium marinum]|uniref:Lipoprotein n=1 Tax=Ulvibacterium marinum TaxID=2419782 RepID=A0A3B0C515_9FLAO|nr:hypothetical protein [Ulvibacterium marinum]RKN81415.1 hypothetical protein D7Z94_10850 [Ulvibacterium marinum]
MDRFKIVILTLLCLIIVSCKTEEPRFPMQKRYWDTNDYKKVTLELNFGYDDDEKLPSFKDPETRAIVEKLTDHQNYEVVLDDEQLGLKHRNGVATEFFRHWRDMQDIYQARDLQDKYLYDVELLRVWQFGLGLQLKYFKLGNDNIKASSDDPNSVRAQNNINTNISTLISNFNIYLDEINNENSFSEEGKELLAEGINKYFTRLIELYPDANFNLLERKIDLLNKKCESEKIKNSLSKIKSLIQSISKKDTPS